MQCASSRESLMYQAATFNSAVPKATALLAETIRDPLITDEEVAQQLDTAAYEIGEIWSKPELILPDRIHPTADGIEAIVAATVDVVVGALPERE